MSIFYYYYFLQLFQLIYQFRQYFELQNLLEWMVYISAVVYVGDELDSEFIPGVKR